MLGNFVEKLKEPIWAMIGIEILGVGLMMIGVLPREAALFLVGIFAFFVMFAPLKQATLFAVFSIPLYTALPITESFDSMAAWREPPDVLDDHVGCERSCRLPTGSVRPNVPETPSACQPS